MKVVVDTSIWSLAFRRKRRGISKEDQKALEELFELISETRAVLIGPVRQEILSGISNMNQFELLKERLEVFENYPITDEDYEQAADFFNRCRSKGIQGSHIDFLICAMACRNKMAIFTDDGDFKNYAGVLDIRLHQVRDLKIPPMFSEPIQ